MEEETQPCPTCETPLDDLGLCPRCLLAAAMEATAAEQPASTAPGLDEISASFPDLEILELIGKGGMGAVYKCRQKSLDRFVALKILPQTLAADESFALRFQAEAKALAALNHPNIVTIHDFGHQGDFYFLLMEFVDGLNLRHLIRDRKLSPEEALAIIPPLCEALEFAHERKIVHRDIKPENLLLDSNGRIKIADFGISTIIGQTDLAGEKATGTPAYMAPEQRTNATPVDARADIYSLGVVLYEMLTGERPDAALTPPSQKATLDVRIDEVVLRALSNQPDQRWQSATEFNTRLQTISTKDPTSLQSTFCYSTPRRARVAAACTFISLLLLWLPFVIYQHETNSVQSDEKTYALKVRLAGSEGAKAELALSPESPRRQAEMARHVDTIKTIEKELSETIEKYQSPFSFGVILSFSLAFIALFVGLILGWRHLSWIRSEAPDKSARFFGMFAALAWPSIISLVAIFMVICLPFNMGGWIYSSLILGLAGAICYPVWLVSRTLAWIRNEPFFKNLRLLILPLVTLVLLYGATMLYSLTQIDFSPEGELASRDRDIQFLEEKIKKLYQARADLFMQGLALKHPTVRSTYAQISAYEEEYQHLNDPSLYAIKRRVLGQLIAEQEAHFAALGAIGLGDQHPDRLKIQQRIKHFKDFLAETSLMSKARTDE